MHKLKVFIVGHDWGVVMAWGLALFRQDKVKALVNLSVPYKQRHPCFKPIAALEAAYGKNYYIVKYQVRIELNLHHLLSLRFTI